MIDRAGNESGSRVPCAGLDRDQNADCDGGLRDINGSGLPQLPTLEKASTMDSPPPRAGGSSSVARTHPALDLKWISSPILCLTYFPKIKAPQVVRLFIVRENQDNDRQTALYYLPNVLQLMVEHFLQAGRR